VAVARCADDYDQKGWKMLLLPRLLNKAIPNTTFDAKSRCALAISCICLTVMDGQPVGIREGDAPMMT
jgi:hypothetical protein